MLSVRMKPFFIQMLAALLGVSSLCAAPAELLPKANPLPLSLDESFQFRKTKIFINDPLYWRGTMQEMLAFERIRINRGAVDGYDRSKRLGDYYTFFWRSKRPADLTFRFEYRTDKLGTYVQAQQRTYPAAKGTIQSNFAVIGDDYAQDGRVTSWRAILIENGKIVALNQSYLWR